MRTFRDSPLGVHDRAQLGGECIQGGIWVITCTSPPSLHLPVAHSAYKVKFKSYLPRQLLFSSHIYISLITFHCNLFTYFLLQIFSLSKAGTLSYVSFNLQSMAYWPSVYVKGLRSNGASQIFCMERKLKMKCHVSKSRPFLMSDCSPLCSYCLKEVHGGYHIPDQQRAL